ncbi:hypothetical protein [Chitinibacter sp. ZOR0017]|uniref:hypothetical protein n=1 Tax=Chitinibacter sp. ZOR0017 TaxID=1339254 RepID=UPI00064763BE|nr:hypothetical protein [Chitinibacter sp. ZOR0017]
MHRQPEYLARIYNKTAEGQAALRERSQDLPAQLRHLLILIDGEKNVASLMRMLNSPSVGQRLSQLAERGLIVQLSQAGQAVPKCSAEQQTQLAAAVAAWQAPASVETMPSNLTIAEPVAEPETSPLEAPLEAAPEQLAQVKTLMINSSSACLGLMAKPLIREIEAISCPRALRATMARWNMALRESRQAAQVADLYLEQAKAMLAG